MPFQGTCAIARDYAPLLSFTPSSPTQTHIKPQRQTTISKPEYKSSPESLLSRTFKNASPDPLLCWRLSEAIRLQKLAPCQTTRQPSTSPWSAMMATSSKFYAPRHVLRARSRRRSIRTVRRFAPLFLGFALFAATGLFFVL